MVQSASAHPDEYFIFPRHRIREIAIRQLVNAAMRVEIYCLHPVLSPVLILVTLRSRDRAVRIAEIYSGKDK
jgi:hypothetical protein